MNALAKKLALKPGMTARVLNAPEQYIALLEDGLEEVSLTTQDGGERLDFVQLFVKNSTELAEHLPHAIESVKHDGLLWLAYPKKTSKIKSDLHRDILWEKVNPYGMVGVSLISIDDTWSCMRFRPQDKVNSTRS